MMKEKLILLNEVDIKNYLENIRASQILSRDKKNKWLCLKNSFIAHEFYIEILQSIDSTNDYLKNKIKNSSILNTPYVVLAEEQFMGRGRNNRKWISPFGKNIYMSIYLQFKNNLSCFSAFSLIIGLAVIKGIEKLVNIESYNNTNINLEDLKIKWPNDVYIKGKKVAGILIDTINKKDVIDAVIGVGVNVNKDASVNNIDTAISLESFFKKSFDRNKVVALIINEIFIFLTLFYENGFGCFKNEWIKYDYLYKREVEVFENSNTSYKGIMLGVDDLGGMLLQVEINNVYEIRKFYNVYKIICN